MNSRKNQPTPEPTKGVESVEQIEEVNDRRMDICRIFYLENHIRGV